MVSDMPELCKFLSLDSCQKSFLWTHKKVLAPYLVIGLMLQVGEAVTFPKALGFESLGPFFQNQRAGAMFHSHRGGWRDDKRLVQLELAHKADGAELLDPV